jgi:hypothetical protein
MWTPGIVLQRFSQLAHSDPQADVKVDKRVHLPDSALNLRPDHYFACIFQKNEEQPERLILNLHPLTLLQKFARGRVHREGAKSIDRLWRSLHSSTLSGNLARTALHLSQNRFCARA